MIDDDMIGWQVCETYQPAHIRDDWRRAAKKEDRIMNQGFEPVASFPLAHWCNPK
jgi:hypothetical protein